MTDAIFLSFHENDNRELADWCFWIDPKTCQATDDYKNGVGIMFHGESQVDLKGLAVLCYATQKNCTKSEQEEMYRKLHWVGKNVPLNNKPEIAKQLHLLVQSAVQRRIKESDQLALQLPSFLDNPVWYKTLLAAPYQQKKKNYEAALQRRPETYKELQEQGDRLYGALQKTVQAMKALKQEIPELPEVPEYFKAEIENRGKKCLELMHPIAK
jgi:hypothetical protein